MKILSILFCLFIFGCAVSKEKVENNTKNTNHALEVYTAPTPPTIGPDTKVLEYDESVVLIHSEVPSYPKKAAQFGVEAKVDVYFSIDSEGKPYDLSAKVNRDPGLWPEINEQLEISAKNAVKKWRYSHKTATGDFIILNAATRLNFSVEQTRN